MSPELLALGLAALIQAAQVGLYALAANRELSPRITLGPRDDPGLAARLSPPTGRLGRAHANHVEALVLFTIAVVLVTETGAGSPLTAACAWIYLAARIAYVPAYWRGLAPWRSVFWAVGFLATLAMILAALAPI